MANRVSKIQDVTETSQWKYVNSNLNPADDASRGLTVQELSEGERWLKGPDFLWKSREHWPSKEEEKVPNILDDDPEVRKNAATTLTTFINDSTDNTEPANDMGERFEKFSSWKCLRKSIAWAIRYVKQLCEIANKPRRGETTDVLKTRAKTPQPLKLDELETANKFILTTVQQSNFQDELATLQEKNGSVKRS